MQLTNIHDGRADYDQTFALINRGYGPDQFFAGQWFETTQEIYWYFLEVLPPMDFNGYGFSMCEFSTGDLTNAFFHINGRFYCMTIERTCREDFRAAENALVEALKIAA